MSVLAPQRGSGSTQVASSQIDTPVVVKHHVEAQAFIPVGEIPAGGSFGVRGQNALVALRAKSIEGTFSDERNVAIGLHQATVTALSQEFARIVAQPGNTTAKSEALIFDALNPDKAQKIAARLNLNNPLLDPTSNLTMALFDPRLAHIVGNLAVKNEFLLSKLFDSYLAELPRMQMEVGGKSVDVVPEEAVNPLASAAVDWAFGRFDSKLQQLVDDGANDEVGNLLLLGHLFGKFDADHDREAHLDILAANLTDAYPVFAKRLVANRMRYDQAFRRLGTDYRSFEQSRSRSSDEQDLLRRLKRQGPGPGPDGKKRQAEKLKQAESAATVAQQTVRTKLSGLKERLAYTAKECGGDSSSFNWQRAAASFPGGAHDTAAQMHLFRSLRSIDIDAVSNKELAEFVQDKLLSDSRFQGFKRLAEARLIGASPAEKIGVAVYTLLLKRADRDDGLAVHQRDWMIHAVDRLLSKPPDLDQIQLKPAAPHFDESRYAIRARRAFERLKATEGGAWISNQAPEVDAELQSRLEQIEDVLGTSAEIRQLLKTKNKLQASKWIGNSFCVLSLLASYGVGYLTGTLFVEDMNHPAMLLPMLVGLIGWQALATRKAVKAGKKLDRREAAIDVDLASSGFSNELTKARDALLQSIASWKRKLRRFIKAGALTVLIGLALGANEPRTSRFVNDTLDSLGIHSRLALPGFASDAKELLFELRDSVVGGGADNDGEKEREASLTNYGPDKEGAADYQQKAQPTPGGGNAGNPSPNGSGGRSGEEQIDFEPSETTVKNVGGGNGPSDASADNAPADSESASQTDDASEAAKSDAESTAKSEAGDGAKSDAESTAKSEAGDGAKSDAESTAKSEAGDGAKSEAKSEAGDGAKSEAKSEKAGGDSAESNSKSDAAKAGSESAEKSEASGDGAESASNSAGEAGGESASNSAGEASGDGAESASNSAGEAGGESASNSAGEAGGESASNSEPSTQGSMRSSNKSSSSESRSDASNNQNGAAGQSQGKQSQNATGQNQGDPSKQNGQSRDAGSQSSRNSIDPSESTNSLKEQQAKRAKQERDATAQTNRPEAKRKKTRRSRQADRKAKAKSPAAQQTKQPEKKTIKTRPVNSPEAPELRPPSVYTFRPDNYPVDFWVSSSGLLDDDGNYLWGLHKEPRVLKESRNFDTETEFRAAVEAEVAQGRMVAVSLDGSTMEHPVGSRAVEILTIGGANASALTEGFAGVRVNSRNAKLVAVVFEPLQEPKMVATRGPESIETKPSDSAFYAEHPRIHRLKNHLKERRDTEGVGSQAALFEVRDSLDVFVDPGLAKFDSTHDSDEAFISSLMETKTVDGQTEFVNDTWNVQQFTAFSHWLDREGGRESVILAGRADTKQAGYGPGPAHQKLAYWFYNSSDYQGYRAVDVMPATATSPAEASEPLDIASMLEESVPLSTVIGYCLAGIALLGGAGLGLRWLMNRRRASQPEQPIDQLADQFAQNLAQSDPAVALGVLSTVRRATEYWLKPAEGSPLAVMTPRERLLSLKQTYLHEVGVQERPRNVDEQSADEHLDRVIQQAAATKDSAHLKRLLSALHRAAAKHAPAHMSTEQQQRLEASQSLLQSFVDTLSVQEAATA